VLGAGIGDGVLTFLVSFKDFDKTRLEWRSEYLMVDSKHVQHWTFDTLLGTLKAQSLRF
jgi:hypothetical protein